MIVRVCSSTTLISIRYGVRPDKASPKMTAARMSPNIAPPPNPLTPGPTSVYSYPEKLSGGNMAPVIFAISVCLPQVIQDDRATILDGVESWYRVVQDGKNKGYAHEKLERVKDTWKYTYRADFEIAAKRDWHLEYRDVEAT